MPVDPQIKRSMIKSKVSKEEFPHTGFPWKLIQKEKKESRTCYFQCEEHLIKYLERYKLKKTDYKIFMIDGEEVQEIQSLEKPKKAKRGKTK